MTPPRHPWLGLILLIVVCYAAAGIGGAITTPKIGGWYATLAKPNWNPPNWIFGPVWSVLYLCMAVAAWLVWRQGGLARAAWPLTLFALQLVLNVAWSWIFFGCESPGGALIDVVLLWAAIVATTAAFWQCSAFAGGLFLPYLCWVAFAAVLNFAVWRLNP